MGRAKQKTKFDKTKCISCAYCGRRQAYQTLNLLYCNYAGIEGQTCLHKVGTEIIDRRGDDYDNCKLYVKQSATHF